MRWPHDSAIARRDKQLVRTRRLTVWIAGGATAASFALAAALGFALPGHAASSGRPASHAGSGRSTGSGGTSGAGGGSSHRHNPARQHRKLSPPHHKPRSSGAPPVVSSGGS
jgi:hypothetical protein